MPKLATIVLLILTVHLAEAPAAAPVKKNEVLRKLTVAVDPIAGSQWSAKPGVRVASDAEEMTGLLGKDIAKQITGKINFAKEYLVHVAWGSAGPPFGELQYEIKDGENGQAITFYIKEPNVEVRGQAFRLGNDFFAVPRNSKVTFGKPH